MIPTVQNPPETYGATLPFDLTRETSTDKSDEETISAHQGEADRSGSSKASPGTEEKLSRLATTLDTIVHRHEQAVEIRSQIRRIDEILLTARSVPALVEKLVPSLQEGPDLVAVRLFVREGNRLASAFGLHAPRDVEIVVDDFLQNDVQSGQDPFILDDPTGQLSRVVFGDAAPLIASAAVARLGRDDDHLGFLCLGTDDPAGSWGNMLSDLITELAHKVSLGLYNAWEHECSAMRAIDAHTPDVYSDPFFHAYLSKEFSRAWRNHSCFSLMAISVASMDEDPETPETFLVTLLKNVLRSSDLVAQGQPGQFWALLPDTNAAAARHAAERITLECSKLSRGNTVLHIGISEFSRNAPTQSALIRETLSALKQAADSADSIFISPTPATA